MELHLLNGRWALRPPDRLLIAFSLATLAVSQVLYNLILNNPQHFPETGAFFVYVIGAVQVIPIAIILTADIVLARFFGESRVTRVWRALLYTFVFLSVLRQAELLSVGPIGDWILQFPNYPALIALAFIALLAFCLFATRALNLLFVYLAVTAAVLTGIFFYQTGLYGPAWRQQAAVEMPKIASSQLPNVFILVFDELSYGVLL